MFVKRRHRLTAGSHHDSLEIRSSLVAGCPPFRFAITEPYFLSAYLSSDLPMGQDLSSLDSVDSVFADRVRPR